MELNTVRKAFAQANDEEAQNMMNELMRRSIRLGLLDALEAEVTVFAGRNTVLKKKAPITEQGVKKEVFMRMGGRKKSFVRECVKRMVKRCN